MKRTTFKPLLRSPVISLLVQNKSLIFIFILFLIGILAGALVVKNADETLTDLIGSLIDNFVLDRKAQKFWMIFWSSFFSVLPYVLLMFVFGVSPAGPVVVPSIMFVRGLGSGLISGYLYRHFAMKGIAFSTLLILPSALIISLAFILASRESFSFSILLARSVLPNSPAIRLGSDFRLYCFRYIFILVILLVAAFLDTVFSISFLRFFDL